MDADYLYIAVESEDTDVWSTFTKRDANTWEQEVIEVFIDADGNKKDYLELQVTPANVVFDAKSSGIEARLHRKGLEYEGTQNSCARKRHTQSAR